MEISKMLEFYNVPSVRLIDISFQNLPQKRLLKLLMDDGIQTTDDLRKMKDEDILALPLFGKIKLEKLREFFTDWYEADFPVKNHLNVNKPETVMRSLEEEVFGNYKNMSIVAMRGQYKTLEAIANLYGQSRQSIQDKEKTVHAKFTNWYKNNNISEKIGNVDDLALYAERNFPEDQTVMKCAVQRLVTVAKWKK